MQITVNALPVLCGDSFICEGESIILSGSGAVNYNWNNGISDGVSFVPNVGTLVYTVIGTDGNGC